MRGSWRPNRTATYWPSLLWPSALCLSRSPGLLNWRPGGPVFCWVLAFSTTSCLQLLVSKLTDFLSSSKYIIVPSPTQSLEWHVWSWSSGNNCLAVHRSLSSGASVYDCTAGFYLVPFRQPSSATPMEYALPPSLEWQVWPGRGSIYNTLHSIQADLKKGAVWILSICPLSNFLGNVPSTPITFGITVILMLSAGTVKSSRRVFFLVNQH